MYTLLVSGAATEQDSGQFTMPRSRFLEYTDDAIGAELRSLSVEAIKCLKSWPCVLMEEGLADQVAHAGRITEVSATPREVSINFEPIHTSFVVTNDALWRMRTALDIAEFEFTRNHVAIKDRHLLDVLHIAGFDFRGARSEFEEMRLPMPPRSELMRARAALGEWSHTELDDLQLEIGLPDLGMARAPGSRRDRANGIVRYAIEHPEAVTAENFLLSAFLVRRALGASVAPTAEAAQPPLSSALEPGQRDAPPSVTQRSPNRVFVVHGQNESVRDAVVAYLDQLGLEGIVLHHQPNMGRHLLTKFIEEAELTTFAVVLMTDDDVGSVRGGQMSPRARQNVILELGYFLARFGQKRVCALITQGLETPSDFDGIVYIRLDDQSNWQRELLRELRAAAMPVATSV